MPRMKTVASEVAPPMPLVKLNSTLGAKSATSERSRIERAAIASPVKALIDSGVAWRASSRRVAVTTISSSANRRRPP